MSKIKNGLNGGKKGFVRLSNEDAVLLNDSESEVELLDVTEMNRSGGNKKRRRRQSSESRCCCGACCISFYLFLLTLLFAVLAIFAIFLAYDFKLMKTKVMQMEVEISQLKADVVALHNQHKDQSVNHTSWLSNHTSSLLNHTSWLLAIQGNASSLRRQLKLLSEDMKHNSAKISDLKMSTNQIDVKQMQRFNTSMAMVSSFSKEVSGIHTSMAQLGSRMEGLENEVTSSGKQNNDLTTQIDKVKETLGDVKDSVSVVKDNFKTRNVLVDSRLTSLTYITGNHTESISKISQAFNQSLLDLLLSAANSASEDIARLENESLELHQSVNWINEELRNLTKEVTSIPSPQETVVDSGNVNKGSEAGKNTSKPTQDKASSQMEGSDKENTGSEDKDKAPGTDETQTAGSIVDSSKESDRGPEDKDNAGSEDTDKALATEDKDNAGSEDKDKAGSEDTDKALATEDKDKALATDETQTAGSIGDSSEQNQTVKGGDLPSYEDTTPDDTQATESVTPASETTSQAITEQSEANKTTNSSAAADDIITNPTILDEETTPSTNELGTPPQSESTPPSNYSSNTSEALDNALSEMDSMTKSGYDDYLYETTPSDGDDTMTSSDNDGGGGGAVDEMGESPEDDKVSTFQIFLKMFDIVDTDQDHIISEEEFNSKFPNKPNVFSYLDIDGDGVITKEELVTAIATERNRSHDKAPYDS